MTELEFQDLCRNVSLELGETDVDALGETGHLEIDDIELAVHFVADQAPDTIFCYTRLGSVPEHQRAVVYENLLRLNMLTGTKTLGVFALDAESEDAVLVVHIPVAGKIDPKGLARRLRMYAKQAILMRGTYLAGPLTSPEATADSFSAQLA
jgi:hypothetical protein